MGVFHIYQIVQMVPNRATHHNFIVEWWYIRNIEYCVLNNTELLWHECEIKQFQH